MKSKYIKSLTLFLISIFIANGNDFQNETNLDKAFITNPIVVVSDIKKIAEPILSEEKKNTLDDIHSATWYNAHGRNTASGERFHKDSLTAAYNFAPFGTYIKVTNIQNDKFVIVKVTDRMGNKSANKIDLSISAFDTIANLQSGRVKVKLEEVEK